MGGAYNDTGRLASIGRLANIAACLAHDAADRAAADRGAAGRGAKATDSPPALFLFTDPQRTPDPVAALGDLPPGCGVVFRHFGAPDRARTARALRAACDDGGHVLVIAADPDLAQAIGADGVHWPARLGAAMTRLAMRRFALNTASAHSPREAMAAARMGADIVFLSPVFASESPSARRAARTLGALRAGSIARAVPTRTRIYALGGVTARSAQRLVGTGLAGVAAVGALAAPPPPPASANLLF